MPSPSTYPLPIALCPPRQLTLSPSHYALPVNLPSPHHIMPSPSTYPLPITLCPPRQLTLLPVRLPGFTPRQLTLLPRQVTLHTPYLIRNTSRRPLLATPSNPPQRFPQISQKEIKKSQKYSSKPPLSPTTYPLGLTGPLHDLFS